MQGEQEEIHNPCAVFWIEWINLVFTHWSSWLLYGSLHHFLQHLVLVESLTPTLADCSVCVHPIFEQYHSMLLDLQILNKTIDSLLATALRLREFNFTARRHTPGFHHNIFKLNLLRKFLLESDLNSERSLYKMSRWIQLQFETALHNPLRTEW